MTVLTRGGASSVDRAARLARVLCGLLGLVLVTVGVLGLLQGDFDAIGDNAPATGPAATVGGLGGSSFLGLAHLIFGAVALVASSTSTGFRLVGMFGSVAMLGIVAYDIVALAVHSSVDLLAVRWPAFVLHLVAWVVTVVIVVAGYRTRQTAGPERS